MYTSKPEQNQNGMKQDLKNLKQKLNLEKLNRDKTRTKSKLKIKTKVKD